MANAETSVIHQIGIHATAETPVPSLPPKGSHIDLATAGFTVIGSRDAGADADIDEDSVEFPFTRTRVMVDPPGSQTAKDAIMRKNGVAPFEFVCYDASETLLELDSEISVAAHIGSMGTTTTKRAVIIEVSGLFVDYFPNCIIEIAGLPAGYNAISKTKVRVTPLGTATIGGGWQRHWFS